MIDRRFITVYGTNGRDGIQVSAGAVEARSSTSRHRDSYLPTAFVPRAQWREPTGHELAQLCAGPSSFDHGSSVAVLDLPDPVRRAIRRVPVTGFRDRPRGAELPTSGEHAELLGLCRGFAASLLSARMELDDLGLVVNDADDQTVTVKASSGRRVGIHLDSWDGRHLTDCAAATNRIGINLSHEPRWLLFCRPTLTTIVTEMLTEVPAQGALLPTYFTRHLDEPIFRIPIGPGQAYIAPTEHMLHDGSTSGSRSPGAAQFYRGYFAPAS